MNGADTAWIIVATALVLFMTLPGLALFYGGLVRARNVLSVFMQCYAIACLMSIIWFIAGYSIAFGDGNAYWGGLGKMFLDGVTADTLSGTLPEVLFFAFQMTFAIITPALIVGAYVERIGFGFVLLFSALWLLICYAPVAHWIWGGGMLSDGGIFGETGVKDFAGGIVVHETAGLAALVLAVVLGPRKNRTTPPHNPGMVMVGAAMLWVGWFGFNGGSQLAADGGAAMALTVTHISAAAASLTWVLWERIKFGKSSLVGMVTGTIAGLASITPASGFVGPVEALIIGGCRRYLMSGSRDPHSGKAEHRRHAGCVCRAWRRWHLWHDHDRRLRCRVLGGTAGQPCDCGCVHDCGDIRADQARRSDHPAARRRRDRNQRSWTSRSMANAPTI